MDVVQRVQLGLQQGYRYGLWLMCGSAAGFIGVLTGIWLRVSLPVLVMAIAGAPIFATALNAIHFFGFVRPDLRPSRELISRDVISQIARLGGLFFVLQVVVAISYSADNFIIARTLGAVNVPEYAIPQRMFGLIAMMSSMLIAPLWPAYGEAISRGHMKWVRHTLKTSLLLVLGATSAASITLAPLAPSPPLVGRLPYPSAVFSAAGACHMDGDWLLWRRSRFISQWRERYPLSGDCRLHLRDRMRHHQGGLRPSLRHHRRSLGDHQCLFAVERIALRSLHSFLPATVGNWDIGSSVCMKPHRSRRKY